jgi:hypothetical protein
MSWDELEVRASDVIGKNPFEHPIQLIMSAERCIKLQRPKRVWHCVHPLYRQPMAYYPSTLDLTKPPPMATHEEQLVEMRLCAIRIPQPAYLYQIKLEILQRIESENFPLYGLAEFEAQRLRNSLWHDSLWAMGLCCCGTLYWCDAGFHELWPLVQ